MSPFLRHVRGPAALAVAVLLIVTGPASGAFGAGALGSGALGAGRRVRSCRSAPAAETGHLLNLPNSLLVTLRAGDDPAEADAAAAARGLVRVAWNPALRTAQYVAAAPSAGSPGELTVAAATARARRVDVRERVRLSVLAEELRRTPGVIAAAPPVRLELLVDPLPATSPDPTPTPLPTPSPLPVPSPVAAPNDTYWSSQWAPDAIGARSAWALTRGRPEILVAVLDTGVDLKHPDLAGRLVVGTDIGAGDSDPTDENGHGTHVAGIIAAVAGNARGVAGIAPTVLVMPVKVMDVDGSIWDTAVAEGIAWAVARGARVINMSLGGDQASPTIDAAIDHARAHGVVVVAAAGNNGAAVSQPAAYPPTLAVAAVEDRPASLDGNGDGIPDGCSVARFGAGQYRHALYSNAGPEVDLAAPGSCIVSTYRTASGSAYASLSGTSMATPMVSAAAALVLSRNPSLTVGQVEAALIGTAADLGTPGPDPQTGAGLLQVGAAVASVGAPASDGVNPAVRWSGMADGTLVRGTLATRATVTDTSPIVATRIYRDGHPLFVRRASSVPIGWASAAQPDGIHTWTAYGTDAGLRVGSSSVRVLVANRRRAVSIRAALAMTRNARSIVRSVTLATRTALVARCTGPSGLPLVLSVIDASGKVVAQGRGAGSAVVALSSLRPGRYRLRALTAVARPGLSLRLTAAWLR